MAGDAVGQGSKSPYQPFTPAWYAQHPKAWQVTHPYAGGAVATAATAASVAAWLGVAYAPTETVIVTGSEQYSQQYDVQTTETQPDADPSAAGEEPSATGGASPAEDAQWMSLGVFEIMPAGQSEASRVVQLAVDREGVVRGTLCDRISDEVGDLHGAIDKQSLLVTWTIGEHGDVVFEIPLAELSKPQGSLTIHFPDGAAGQWRTRPLADEPARRRSNGRRTS